MKENLTELLFSLDCCTAAGEQADEAVKAYKSFINSMKKLDEEIRTSVVTFNDTYGYYFNNIPIKKLKPSDYGFGNGGISSGACPMLDASAYLMDDVGKRLSDTPEEERPSHVIFTICVFGRDNASKSCTYEKLREMIALQRDVYKWKFYLITDFTINMEKLGIAEDDTIVIKKDEANWFKRPFQELGEKIKAHLGK
ncbi:MAG: hypothetical protein ACI4J4_08720 [Ruminiclostridium sp.]